MRIEDWTGHRRRSWVAALSLCVIVARTLAGQGIAPSKEQVADAAAFEEFSSRVQAYVTLQTAVAASLPILKPTDLPEMITAHQEVLARKLREARPHAKTGDIFTPAACEAFHRASHATLEGPGSAATRASMQSEAPNPRMRLEVNGIYPDTEPITAVPPALLAAFPPLPAAVAYRIVGRSLILLDVESRLIVDVARRVLPSAS